MLYVVCLLYLFYVIGSLGADETLLSDVLRANAYSTYAVGKWNLGHYAPDFLPTARGFDSFLGFLGAETYYWYDRMIE
jgi:arylsulfatase B